jgi:hypothetical protein
MDDTIRDTLGLLKDLEDGSSPLNHHIIAICRKQIDWLEVAFKHGKELAIAWFAMVSKEYIELVERGEPLARLIFMLWGVLLDQLRGQWWVGHTGMELVVEMEEKLQNSSPTWKAVAKRVRACLPGTQSSEPVQERSAD